MLSKLLRALGILVLAALLLAAGAFATWKVLRAPRDLPDSEAVALQIREVARLETLEVSLYKKVSFDAQPEAGASLTQDVLNWAKFTLRPPEGRAIVFATGRLGLDLQQLDRRHLRVHGGEAWVVLPPLDVQVELKPGETEVIGSNLDSQQTAQLLQTAKEAFEAQLRSDARLKERARGSAERSIRGLLLSLGFSKVSFVETLPSGAEGS